MRQLSALMYLCFLTADTICQLPCDHDFLEVGPTRPNCKLECLYLKFVFLFYFCWYNKIFQEKTTQWRKGLFQHIVYYFGEVKAAEIHIISPVKNGRNDCIHAACLLMLNPVSPFRNSSGLPAQGRMQPRVCWIFPHQTN